MKNSINKLVFPALIALIFGLAACSNPAGGSPRPIGGQVPSLPVDRTTLYMSTEAWRDMLPIFLPAFPEMTSASTEWPAGVYPAFVLIHRCNDNFNSDVSSFLTPDLKDYVNKGGIIITELNTSHQVYNYFFDTSYPLGDGFGDCGDVAATEVQFSPSDPFWQAIPFETSTPDNTGVGYDMSNLPNITRLAGWSEEGTVSMGYINYGYGRIWLLECDWQDGDGDDADFAYTASILRYMATHTR
jgi:hypothetical protein